MFNSVIVGVDGAEGGRDAIALAKVLLAEGGRLTLGNVYPGESYVWRGGTPIYQMIERDDSQALLEREQKEAEVDAELHSFGDPSIGKGLHVLAEQVGADLLVVGSSRRTLVGRIMVGDDTRAALNGAPCAVAVASGGYAAEPRTMREIGVGYNGSLESEHALGVARQLAARYGTKLSAFEAIDVPTYVAHGTTAPDSTPIKVLVDQARERIAALGGVEPHVAYGHPAEELALYGASLDLLVIGSRSYGPVGRLVHGSTAQQLARTARCPLLVLTRASRKADAAAAVTDGREVAAAGAAT